jgi:hypothetical protein
MRKFGILVWSQADDETWGQNNIYTESCVVREGLKGKGGQGMETCLKQLYTYIFIMVGLHMILKTIRAHEVSH